MDAGEGPEGRALSLVALADGRASVYFEGDGGLASPREDASSSRAVRTLFDFAMRDRSRMKPLAEFLPAEPGQVNFYLLTGQGVLAAGGLERELRASDHVLSGLYSAGEAVVGQLKTSAVPVPR